LLLFTWLSYKAANISKYEGSKPMYSNEEYQGYLRFNSSSLSLRMKSRAKSFRTPSLSTTTCVSQSMESQNPWIIDSGAYDRNISFFSFLSFHKIPCFIMLANKSSVASQGIGEVSLSPSLILKFVPFVHACSPISLSQLSKS